LTASVLPNSLVAPLERTLRRNGDRTKWRAVEAVTGGDINRAARLTTGKRTYLVKWNSSSPPGVYGAECNGLQTLRSAGALRVPEVVGFGECEGNVPGFLVLEWIEQHSGPPPTDFGVRLGQAVAKLHSCTASAFGFERDNYIGSLGQPNGWLSDWLDFYRERRLRPQAELARRLGRLPIARARRMGRLLDHLERWLTGDARPALVHGDLWYGNLLVDSRTQPVVVDPAVYFADREVEIAFSQLFGGFPEGFYQAYREAWPLDSGYDDRRELLQLYPLLVHLNTFGETYAASVDRVLKRYVG
jgi:fructosamine-3-kinase